MQELLIQKILWNNKHRASPVHIYFSLGRHNAPVKVEIFLALNVQSSNLPSHQSFTASFSLGKAIRTTVCSWTMRGMKKWWWWGGGGRFKSECRTGTPSMKVGSGTFLSDWFCQVSLSGGVYTIFLVMFILNMARNSYRNTSGWICFAGVLEIVHNFKFS